MTNSVTDALVERALADSTIAEAFAIRNDMLMDRMVCDSTVGRSIVIRTILEFGKSDLIAAGRRQGLEKAIEVAAFDRRSEMAKDYNIRPPWCAVQDKIVADLRSLIPPPGEVKPNEEAQEPPSYPDYPDCF